MWKTSAELGRGRAAILALAAIAVGSGACGGARDDRGPGAAAHRDTLVFAAPADATTLDPHNTTDNQSDQVILMVYDTLIAFDGRMQIVGKLADRWSVAADAVTWSFHLRPGIRFHDGTPFDALSVKKNFDRVLDPAQNHKRLLLFNMIDRVEVVDAENVRIVTKYPFSAFEPTMAHVSAAIVNPVVAGQYGKTFGTTAESTSGTGPYKAVRWKKDLEVVLERNDDYWGDKGRLRRVVYRPIPEAASRIVALEVGDVDAITSVPPADMARLEQSANVRILKTVSVGAQQFRFNCARKPFTDPRVRQAVSFAIDRRAIVKNLVSTFAAPSTGPLTPVMRGSVRLGEIPYDPEKARRLLAEAGYPNGFRTTISTTARYNMGVELAEAVAADLKKVGIDAAIEIFDWGTMVQFWAGLRPEQNPQQMFIMGAGASTADADWGLRPIFMTHPTNENNYGYYSNKEFDRVIVEAMRETNPERRQALYKRAQEIVYLEDPGAVWLFDNYFIVATRSAVSGVSSSPIGVVTFEKATVIG